MIKGSLFVVNSRNDPGRNAVAQDASPPLPGTPTAATAGKPASGKPAAGNGDINLENIVKLIPGEVIAVYMSLIGLLKDKTVLPGVSYVTIVFVLALVCCVLLRAVASVDKNVPVDIYSIAFWRAVNKPLVGVSCVAFVIWSFAVNETNVLGWPGAQTLAGVLAAFFGLLAPLLVPARSAAKT